VSAASMYLVIIKNGMGAIAFALGASAAATKFLARRQSLVSVVFHVISF
jgi:hypothetical protein